MGLMDHEFHLGLGNSPELPRQHDSVAKSFFSGPMFDPQKVPGQNVTPWSKNPIPRFAEQWEDDVRILEEFPEVVYVQFANSSWQIEGAPGPGIYPITKVKRNWHLDKGRQYPQLAIQREQLPLALWVSPCI